MYSRASWATPQRPRKSGRTSMNMAGCRQIKKSTRTLRQGRLRPHRRKNWFQQYYAQLFPDKHARPRPDSQPRLFSDLLQVGEVDQPKRSHLPLARTARWRDWQRRRRPHVGYSVEKIWKRHQLEEVRLGRVQEHGEAIQVSLQVRHDQAPLEPRTLQEGRRYQLLDLQLEHFQGHQLKGATN